MKAAVLLTCFNRKQKTLSCLESVYAQSKIEDLDLDVYLVDDGSSDGTAAAVAARFPDVKILCGDGNLYWNGGMNMAWKAALDEGFEYYLWINDDVELQVDAFSVLFQCLHSASALNGSEPVIVGCFCESGSGEHAYGGFSAKKTFWRVSTKRIIPNGSMMRCDTFNGNLVLIPHSVIKTIGILDERYTHSFGDKDYGLRCMRHNIPMYITPDYIGQCSRNSIKGTWLDPELPLRERYRRLRLPTGLPPGEYFYSCRKYCGHLACSVTMIKLFLRLMFPKHWSRLSKRAGGE